MAHLRQIYHLKKERATNWKKKKKETDLKEEKGGKQIWKQ
jgi:hypothetical protein